MKRIRNLIALCLCAVLLSTTIMTAVGAVVTPDSLPKEETVASELYTVGILRGDGKNFNLGDIPDRLQACVMVVRMRGEEEQALAAYKSGKVKCPFTDVTKEQDWAKPYIAWLYDKGITNGIGDNKFGNGPCTAQMYAAFMLRALGYKDTAPNGGKTDFAFDDAISFAQKKKIGNSTLLSKNFDRGNMASVTYLTLAADVKGSNIILLQQLVNAGAIKKDTAKALLDKFVPVVTPEPDIEIPAETVTLLTTSNASYEFKGAQNSSDKVDAAAYARNRALEQEFGISLNIKTVTQSKYTDELRRAVTSGDTAYDFTAGRLQDLFPLAAEGHLRDLNRVLGINLSAPWWESSINESLSVAGKQFFAAGDLLLSDNTSAQVLFYNSDVGSSLGITDPVSQVLSGTWTLDALHTAAKAAADASVSSILTDGTVAFSLYESSGEKLIGRDSSKLLALTVDPNRAVNLYERVAAIPGMNVDSEFVHMQFAQGDALFSADTLSSISRYAESGANWQVLPMPKANASQGRYYTVANANTYLIAVPKTSANPAIGEIIDAMAESSAAYEDAYLAQWGGGTRSTMLETIFDSTTVDLVYCSTTAQDLLSAFDITKTNIYDAVLTYALYEKTIMTELSKYNSAISAVK